MRKATRLIIEEGNNIIFIKRTKKINGGIKTYYVLPGGQLDEGEDWEHFEFSEGFLDGLDELPDGADKHLMHHIK